MTKMSYWAVVPKSTLETLENCRIEKAPTALEAYDLAFGMGRWAKDHPLAKYSIGMWMAKNLGTVVTVIRSDKKRVAALKDRSGWFDPFA